MRTLRRALTVLGAVTAILAATAIAVQADSSDLAKPTVNPATGGYYAELNGDWIDLSQGWQGAQVCTQQDDASFVCYDDVAEFRDSEGLPASTETQPLADSDCAHGFLCLWDNRRFNSILLRLNKPRTYELGFFGNKANSIENNRSTRSLVIDNDGYGSSSGTYSWEVYAYMLQADLGAFNESRGDGTNWNNKIDIVKLRDMSG